MLVVTVERKNSILTGRNLQQNQAQCERTSAEADWVYNELWFINWPGIIKGSGLKRAVVYKWLWFINASGLEKLWFIKRSGL